MLRALVLVKVPYQLPVGRCSQRERISAKSKGCRVQRPKIALQVDVLGVAQSMTTAQRLTDHLSNE